MIEHLDGERFVSVQTFRHSGGPVATPVWFASFEDGFVFGTHTDSGKVRRIRAEPAVRFAAANYRGLERRDYTDGCAEILGGHEAVAAESALSDKYGWQWFPFSRLIDCYVRVVPNRKVTDDGR
ncbi:MAG: PPOX class F420-dependent oxidoreductase [Acidimicrobiia bacterium]